MNEKVSAIIFIILGLGMLLCFYLLKKKHKVTILKEFMYKNLKKSQINKFCEEMSYVFFFLSMGTLLIGFSYFAGFVNVGAVALVISMFAAIVTYKKLQVKYRFRRTLR